MPRDLKSLTALRFFAALWVVAYDFWPSLGGTSPALAARGYLGVDLFFTLSGFILSHVYLEQLGEGRFDYAGFLWARLARIYPVHLATLAGIGLLAAGATALGLSAGDKVLVWSSLPAQLTLTHAWGLAPRGGWNHPSWSISAEWFAYLLFPAFGWAAWRLKGRPALAMSLALALLLGLSLAFPLFAGIPMTKGAIEWGVLRIVPCFALGCATYLCWAARPMRQARAALIAAVAALGAILACVLAGGPDWLSTALFAALIFSLASLSLAGFDRNIAPAFVYLGEVSYSLYMVWIPWQLAFEKAAHRLLPIPDAGLPPSLWILGVAGAIPIAMLTHHLIERPAREAMRRHGVPFRRRRAEPAADFTALPAGQGS